MGKLNQKTDNINEARENEACSYKAETPRNYQSTNLTGEIEDKI